MWLLKSETLSVQLESESNPLNMHFIIKCEVMCKVFYAVCRLIYVLGGFEDFDQEIMAQVLAESQQSYLDELKSKSRKRHASPGPSTST